MAGEKEIRTQIRSIENTQKITRAMEMVAGSKMRKAQERMQHARPYADKMRNVISHVAAANSEYKHPFLDSRVVQMDEWRQQGIEADFCVFGNKAAMFFKRFRVNILAQATHLGDQPAIEDLIGTIKVMLDAYTEGTIDSLYLVYNQFVNSMTQQPVIEQLLPREPSEEEEVKHY